METAVQAFDPTVVPFRNKAGLYVVDSLDHIDPSLLDPDSRAELARLRVQADATRENSRSPATRRNYSYWLGRYELWCADPSVRRDNSLPWAFRPWPVDLSTVVMFLTDFSAAPKVVEEDEEPEWVAPAWGTVQNILSALMWQTQRDNIRWNTTPDFDRFLAGLRNQLNEATATVPATPLEVEQLAVVGACLAQPSPETFRDLLVVVCHGLRVGQAATARLTRSDAKALAGDESKDAGLRQHLSYLLDQPVFACRAPEEPLIGCGRQQVRQILLRCSRDAGISDGSSSIRHSPDEVFRLIDWLYNLPDPAGIRDHAILTVGFAAALRRSELSRAEIAWIELKDNGFHYKIHFSKTNKSNRPEQVGVPESPHISIDPNRSLRKWLAYLESKGRAEQHMPLFPTIDRHGNLSEDPVSGDAIAEMIRKRVLEAGVAATAEEAAGYAGHSLRRGFCTSAAKRGLDALRIASQTRHKNLAEVQRYVDHAHSIDPEHNAAARVLS